jgi:ABC-type branched-subunit amino acid transport system substrate-binding protein
VFAAGFFVGTPTAAKYVPLAEADKLPVVGLFTGAQMLYEPLKRYVVPVRASYGDETREQVDGLWNAGSRKIAVIYQSDAFGEAVLSGVKAALAKHNSNPVALGTFARNTLDVDNGIKTVMKAHPDAVILAGPYAPVAKILVSAHGQAWRPIFVTVSFVGTEALINAAGADAEGVAITQVVPPYDRTDLATVRLYRSCLEKYMSNASPSFVSFEAFVDAMVMAEGLKRAGRDLTREKFVDALEGLKDVDMGLGPQMRLHYSATGHHGFTSVYPTVVRNGKPIVFGDWKSMR